MARKVMIVRRNIDGYIVIRFGGAVNKYSLNDIPNDVKKFITRDDINIKKVNKNEIMYW